ncbi:MAG: permease-like cell division protein FtsX [Eubacteriaceae bacterium]|jgi:cell division transport system permease protein
MPSREKPTYAPSIFREAFQSLTRNALMTTAAAVSIVAALIILGVFILFSSNIQQMTANVESNLEIKVFLKDGTTDAQKETIYETLKSDPNTDSIRFETKAEALDNFSSQLQDYTDLLGSYSSSDNPLPESYIVTAKNGEDIQSIVTAANSLKDNGVEYVKYGENYINSLLRFNHFINVVSIVMLVIMSVIALFLIYNTIRLTVVNRSREIQIMKYVGATDRYIQAPFVLEGILLGTISAAAAVLFIRLAYLYVLGMVNGSVMLNVSNSLISPNMVFGQLSLIFILYGIVIGAVGAVIATRKFLDV